MKRFVIAVAAAVVATACQVEGPAGPQGEQGPVGPAAGAPLESGTRIRMLVGRTDDGAKLFMGWHDAELGVDCEFAKTVDGEIRCVPSMDVVSFVLYSDAQCTQFAVGLPESASAAKYARNADNNRAFEIGAPVHFETVFNIGSDGACNRWNEPYDAYTATEITASLSRLSISVD